MSVTGTSFSLQVEALNSVILSVATSHATDVNVKSMPPSPCILTSFNIENVHDSENFLKLYAFPMP